MSETFYCLLLQLKQQHKEHSEERLAIEELERNIRLAEEVCPGITDRMVTHIIARYQKYVHHLLNWSHSCHLHLYFLRPRFVALFVF